MPSVRWYLRRRLERAVERLNRKLSYPIQPFKLARRRDTILRLRYDPEVAKAVLTYAREKGIREDVAAQTAERYAREIVPSFSAFAYFGFGIRLARLLANQATLWILDEPFTALDVAAVELLQDVIQRHVENQGIAIITTPQEVAMLGGQTRTIVLGKKHA